MVRLVAVVVAFATLGAAAPQTVVLKITVAVTAADGSSRPVPRHVLLISDDPVTSAPQRFVTKADGAAEAHLKPGRYIVESDTPFVFQGKAYEWVQPVTVAATGETALALTAANATIAAKPGRADSPSVAEAAAEDAEAALLTTWQDSIVTVWTPHAAGRGFLADPRGLVLTNQRIVGKDTAVEVQFSATKKVAGRVIASDTSRNVAVIWIDPQAAAPARPMTLGYAEDGTPRAAEHDKVYSIEGRTGEAKDLVSGGVERVSPHALTSDVPLGRDSSGVPLFIANGAVVAITTGSDESAVLNELSPRAIPIDDAKPALATAEKTMQGAAPPPASLLPVDPARPFPEAALEAAAKKRGSGAAAYLVAGADFDVNIITPPMVYASMHRQEDDKHFDYARDDPGRGQILRPLDDFGNWSEYVSEAPPVVLVRVTPKFGENFWTTVARGAAQTQGVSIPPIKRPKAAFGGLRLTCGETAVAPIHPFRIEHPLGDTTSIDEGLYVFDVSAFSPQCGAVKITVLSDKAQDKGDTRSVDSKIVQQVWDDFAAYR